MSNYVSVIYANTYSYKDKESICNAVNLAIEKLQIGQIIKPGMNVLIKPNLVMDINHNIDGGTDCLYTQAEVVEPVLSYVIECLCGQGSIVIGDAPMQECVFENIVGYKQLVEKYSKCGIPIRLVDFRELTSYVKDGVHYKSVREDANGSIINLGKDSEFYLSNITDGSKMRVTNYDPRILPKHHHGDIHEYYVSNYLLNADVIINMPKPKSHRKGGVTISLKNLVGINTRKEFLPHHMKGSKANGGDEYLKKSKIHSLRSSLLDMKNTLEADNKHTIAKLFKYPIGLCSLILKQTGNLYSEGSWYGNDTISKTIVDLNRIAMYADKNGVIRSTPQRNMIIVADMIVSGEKEGPVNPSPKDTGIIVAGTNPVCFDEVVSTLMGFDYNKIPSIVRARKSNGKLRLINDNEEADILSNSSIIDGRKAADLSPDSLLWFEPTSGWKNHIELSKKK